jgi:hypothetical protein
LFKGNISVFRNVGESPFRFSLSHDSAAGYAKHSLTDGFTDRLTKIEIEKSYKNNKFSVMQMVGIRLPQMGFREMLLLMLLMVIL